MSDVGSDPNVSDIIEAEFVDKFIHKSVGAEIQYAHLRGLQDHYRHKSKWSWFLMGLMFGMVAFQSFLLYKVGAGAWDFTQYEWLLPLLLVQNLAQVVGLATFVVKALFKEINW